jgi:protease-4
MALKADEIMDRRRLRRSLGLWRGLAIGAAVIGVLALGLTLLGRGSLSAGPQQIARVTVSGVITGDKPLLKLIDDVGKSASVAGVVVAIDSPGGTVPGSEALHEALRRLSARKPTVAVVENLAASGGYIAAMGADRIVARKTSIVGSIGVIFQFPNVTRLLDTVGVRMETVRSTPLKAAPSGLEPTSPEALAAINDLVQHSYAWFRGLVTARRGIEAGAPLDTVADGRVFPGEKALGLKLVDEIGSEREAIAWMERERNVAKDLPVRDWKTQGTLAELGLRSAVTGVLESLGLAAAPSAVERLARRGDALLLDGLVALWQPSLSEK